MEQLFDVLGPVAILVFIAIGKLIETVFKGKENQRPAPRKRPSRPTQRPTTRPSPGDGDLEDVQERIRRLIMERAGIEEDPPPRASLKDPKPEPEYFQPVLEEPSRPLPPPPPTPRHPKPALLDAYSLIHNVRKPSANMKKLGLGTKDDLRKAILQREILGPPLALREEQKEQW
jgi:hypothetical protein